MSQSVPAILRRALPSPGTAVVCRHLFELTLRAWSSGTEDGSHGSVDSIVAQGADAVVDGLDCSGG